MATSKNDITGDKIKTKPTTKEYSDGWDAIFGDWERTKHGDLIPPKGGCCGGHACESDKEEDKCKPS